MPIGFYRTAAILGLLASVGPFAIDMYLPALPTIAADLGTTVAGVQITLTAFFIAFGTAQMVYGPWSDQVGRKLPLYVGLLIFIAGSLGCVVSPSIEWLVASRFLQGMGAAVVMVMPRAIVRDLYTGTKATRLMSSIMLVISVSPMLAPLAGSLLILSFDWHSIFLVLAVGAVISLLLVRFSLTETLPQSDRVPVNVRNMVHGMKVLLTDRMFLGLTFIGGFSMASFFVFIASASFVYTQQFGLTPMQFSLAFAINAAGFFGASQFAATLGDRFGMERVVAMAVVGFFILTSTLLMVTLAGYVSLPIVVGFLFCANACLGLVIPTAMVLALDAHGHIAGLASSLGGTLQMVCGGVMIAIASQFFDGTTTPMVFAIAVCGWCVLTIRLFLFAGRNRARGLT